MKYPKLRDGPNPVGEALHRALQRTGAPFISAEGVGYGANKYGAGAEVYGGLKDGFYCLGSLEPVYTAAPFQIAASTNARGVFAKEGSWSGGAFQSPALNYVGYGRGVAPTASSPGTSTLSSTKDGKTFKPILTFSWGQDGNATSGWTLHSGARYTADGEGKWTWGIVCAMYKNIGGTWNAYGSYIFTLDRGQTWQRTDISLGARIFQGLPFMHRLTPSKNIMIVPVYAVAEGTWAVQTSPLMSTILRLDDYGAAYTNIGGGELVSKLLVCPTGPVTSGQNAVNARISDWARSCYAVPLVNGEILYLAPSEYYDGYYSSGTPIQSGMWAFRGSADAGPSYIGKVEIPGVDTFYAYALQHDGLPIGAAVPVDSTEVVRFIVGSADGSSWEYKPMPFARRYTGGLLSIDKNTVVCPMYDPGDNVHVLMQTKDLGDTWTRRAVIQRGAPAPSSARSFLDRFSTLTYMRKNDLAAPTFPGAPWMGDDRITPPWEI